MVTNNRHPQSSGMLLAELARLYGVQTAYRDSRGRWRESPLESVAQVLRALGAPLGDGGAGRRLTPSRMTAAIRERKLEVWNRVLEPTLVAWDGVPPTLTIHLPEAGQASVRSLGRTLRFALQYEGGGSEYWEVPRDSLEMAEAETLGRTGFVAYRVARAMSGSVGIGPVGGGTAGVRSARLPLGYHRLRVETGEIVAEATMISAPRRCWAPGQTSELNRAGEPERGLGCGPAGTSCRNWGVFAPLYALRSERNWGAGDLADLGALCDWVADRGGDVVATLPLLASFLDRPFEPAPYRPVSRLFWNELYLAVDEMVEWGRCAIAREIWGASETQARVRTLRAEPLVDYRAVMALKRQVLEELARCFFAGADTGRKEAFAAYLRDHPHAEEYAAFRAQVEGAGDDWRALQGGSHGHGGRTVSAPGVLDRVTPTQYHLYCQWQMEEQLERLSRGEAHGALNSVGAKPSGSGLEPGRCSPGLFLDLPLGVHPDGFDTWRWPELFVGGMSAGAPRDDFFAHGQHWDLLPLHPQRIREQGHHYFVSCLRHHMGHARYLRIDHVMSLHRLFWVPEGMVPMDGVYVAYPADELYAVLCLESHRNRTVVVGEDLGTVPPEVRPALRRHGLLRTWVLQTALRLRAVRPVEEVPRHAVASLNTHDMFPFAGFLRGEDIIAGVETRQVDREDTRRQMAARQRMVARLAELLPPPPAAGNESPLWGLEPEPTPGLAEPAGVKLLSRALGYLANSQADLVVVNLEDLLLETRPQNVPGTGVERGNWRRKIAGSEVHAERATAILAQGLASMEKP